MTTPQPTPPPGPSGTRSSLDWLASLILTAKTITAAAECLPFPYLKGALGPVIPILEAVQKMTKNRDDFEELCKNIVSTVKVLQEKISRHDVTATTSLQQLCGELECLLDEIRLKVGQIQKSRKNQVLGRLKEFSKSTSIGDELARYKTRLEKLRSDFIDIGTRHVALLHGLGGAGKTQICLKFLAETDKSRFTNVFFLDASTTGIIKAGLKNIALTRSIGSEDDDASRWLASSQDEWLLIFDNADDPSINLFNYFPLSSSGNILITSRNPQLHVHAPDAHHHISDMEEEDAAWLLLASAVQPRTSVTENLARDIVKALYCFPLAVVQAGAFIARTGTLRKYLALYEQNRAELLSRLPDQTHDKYAWSVYTTWDISFRCLGQMAAQFLQICSFLHHEGISETLFSSAARYKHHTLGPTQEQMEEPYQFLNNFLTQAGSWDEVHFTDMAAEIKGYSLINEDPNTNLFSIHPLVHDWSRKTIVDTTSTRECSAAILAMSTMSNSRNTVFLIGLLPHINYVLHGDHQLGHKFPFPFQRVFYDSGCFYRAQELCVALLENMKHTLGSEHSETLFIMENLVAIYGTLGKFTDAEELQVAVLDKRKQILGPEHPDTLVAMSNLAATYWKLGNSRDALKLFIAVLEKRKQILGPEHPDTLAAMSSLAATYWKLGKLTEAEELEVAVLEKRKQTLGPEHPKTLAAMSNLAATYHSLGKLMDAEDLKVVVLEKRKQILGPEHPDTLDAMSNLAGTYHSVGKFADAEELYVVVLEKRKQIFGTEHPDTLTAMSSLAATYWKLGKFTEAEELEVAVLEKRKQTLGPEHPDTLDAMSNLAGTYHSVGKFADAEELYVVVLEKRKQIFGTQYPDTLTAMSSLAITYHDLGKLTEAEELKVTVLEKRKQIFGLEHPHTLHAMSELAATYHSLRKFTDAEELDVAVLAKRKQILGTEHHDSLNAMSRLATTYWKLGKFTDAEELEVAVLEKRTQLFGTEHPKTLTSMDDLALTYRELGKFAEAEQLMVTVLEKKTSTLGPQHKETTIARERLTKLQQHIKHHASQISSSSLLS
ncbi:hypothetical protein C8J57DRAFT_1577235 [Mycena rebaudengoi]|nr:hypothetical protein C8J57DRAFT_1577235 [Mycena rebaudengoi]